MEGQIEYLRVCSDLDGLFKSVPSPFQVRFKSVSGPFPYIGDIIPQNGEEKAHQSWGD